MPDLPLNSSRRKPVVGAEPSSLSQEGGGSIVPTAIALILAVLLVVWLIAPNQVDSVFGRTAAAVAGKDTATDRFWHSIVSTLTSDEGDREQIASSTASTGATVLQPNQSVTTGSTGRMVLTLGHDILELAPRTTIAVGDARPEATTTIIRLLDGTVHVKAAKRTDGQTFSVETQYLVATVKGTKFDVMTSERGAAVSVTEGLVSVRPAGSSDGVDVAPGNTAVVLAADGAAPVVGPTPVGGAPAAIDAARALPINAGAGVGAIDGGEDNTENSDRAR